MVSSTSNSPDPAAQISNRFISEKLNEVADLLEQQGANLFRVRAYRDASAQVANLPGSVAKIVAQGNHHTLVELPSIGTSIAAAIEELVKTGRLRLIERLQGSLEPEKLFQMIPSIGPKLAEVIHLEEGIFANYSLQSWLEISELRVDEKRPHDDWIRSVSFEIQAPRVIRLLGFDRVPKQTLHLNRRGVLARDNHTCQYCARRFAAHELSLDHVMPRSRGGCTEWENVVCACLTCNVKKGGRTPREARMLLGRKPYRPSYSPLLTVKLANPKYESWKTWLVAAHSEVGV